MRLSARGRRDHVIGLDRHSRVSNPTLTFARYDKEKLVNGVMAVKRKSLLARRHDDEGAAEARRSDDFTDLRALGDKFRAVAEIRHLNVVDIDDPLLRHSWTPKL